MPQEPALFVSMDRAREHLRVDGAAEDALIRLYLGAAQQSAVDYLNRSVYATAQDLAGAVADGTGGLQPMVCNFAIQAAILLILGHLYANREDVADGNLRQLPLGARSLLWPHRLSPGV